VRQCLIATLLSSLTSIAIAETVTVPGDQTQYTHQGPGELCLTARVTDIEGDQSDPSNEVCQDTPATWEWVPPIEYISGIPIGQGELDFYTLTFETVEPPPVIPGPVRLLQVGTWEAIPRTGIYSLPTTSFNGSNHVDAGNFSVPGQSLEIIANVVFSGSTDPYPRIISKCSASGQSAQDHDFMLSLTVNNQPRFRLKTNGFTTTLVGPSVIPLNTLVEIRATYDGASMRLFVDGALDAQTAKTGDMNQSNKPVWVGANPNGAGFWVGDISVEVR